MSANNAIVIRKVSPDKFEIRDVCVDTYKEPILDKVNGEPTGKVEEGFLVGIEPSLERAIKRASKLDSEYGISYEDQE